MGHHLVRTGELARMTSVSVRTLRFYDKVGLLSPSVRTPSGYRLYSETDLVRLQQILALKYLGFSLEEIKAFLGASPRSLREALAQQGAMLRERRAHLDTIIKAIDRLLEEDRCEWESLVEVIQAMQMSQNKEWPKKYFTDEQLRAMQELSKKSYSEEALQRLQARGSWTEEDQRRIDERYNALYAGVRRLVAEGGDPGSDEAQALARESIALIEEFTGGDPEIAAGLQRWWEPYHSLPADQRPFADPLTPEEQEFLERAKAIYRERQQG